MSSQGPRIIADPLSLSPFGLYSQLFEEVRTTHRKPAPTRPDKKHRQIGLGLAQRIAAGQDTIFDTYRHHGFFTTISPEVLDTAAADRAHRGHAVIEQVNAELKGVC